MSDLKSGFLAADSLVTATILSVSAGFLDGFTYIGHGHTFASAMTGNMVLLGIALTQSGSTALAYVYPIVAYIIGSIAANLLARPAVRARMTVTPHLVTLCFEIAVLVSIPFWGPGVDDHFLVAIITISTAMQNTSFRNIGTRTYNSVIMTGNLQSFSNAVAQGVWPGDRAAREGARHLAVVLTSFVIGAAAGAYSTSRLQDFATLIPAALLFGLAVSLSWATSRKAAVAG